MICETICAKDVGKRLEQLRKNNNVAQYVCAEAMGCDKATYSRYEKGKRLITTRCIGLLVDRLYPDLSIDWLLYGKTRDVAKSHP